MRHTGFLDLQGAGATFPWGGRFCSVFSCCTALGYMLTGFRSISLSLSLYIYMYTHIYTHIYIYLFIYFALKALLFNQRPTQSYQSSSQQAACKAAWLAAVFLSRNLESQLRLVELSDWLAPRAPPQACTPARARVGYPRDRGGRGHSPVCTEGPRAGLVRISCVPLASLCCLYRACPPVCVWGGVPL